MVVFLPKGITMNLLDKVRKVPDFPKPGILFYDITTLLKDADGFQEVVHRLDNGPIPDYYLGIDARGFILAGALAYKNNRGLVVARKKGKLPYQTYSHAYALEYGTDELHVHTDAIETGASVVILDDLLATGGTANAAINLVKKSGGVVQGVCFVIELDGLGGRNKLIETGINEGQIRALIKVQA